MNAASGESVFRGVIPVRGFYGIEQDENGPFVWARLTFALRIPSGDRRFAVRMCSYSQRGKLSVHSGDQLRFSKSLYTGWHTYTFDFSDFDSPEVTFTLNHVPKVPGDQRELGLMIRTFEAVANRNAFAELQALTENRFLNREELAAGKEKLTSLPRRLRISLETRCNVTPPCVYCEWQWAKDAEKPITLPFTTETLKSLGSFYAVAEEVVDCSHGEPFLHPHLRTLVRRFVQSGKRFEMTTNGQLLTARNRRKIADQDMILYVSMDSPSSVGYRSYRNDRFERVLENLRLLCKEKQEHGDRLRVIVAYIVMQSNIRDLGSFVKLMGSIGVDGIKLRRLFSRPRMLTASTTRNGQAFVYEDEMVALTHLSAAVQIAEHAAGNSSLAITSELDFLPNNCGPGSILCKEPWETMYVMHRGIHVCCYSKDPIAYWHWRDGKPGDAVLRKVWNGAQYRELRRSLARGELHLSCLERPGCPIVAAKTDTGL